MIRKIVLFLFIWLLVVMLIFLKWSSIEPLLQRIFSDSKTTQTQKPTKPVRPVRPYEPIKPIEPVKPVLSIEPSKPKPEDLPKPLLNQNKRLGRLLLKNFDKNNVKLRISKSKYKLSLIYDTKVVKEYPIVLGADPVNDKLREGDRRTPEGTFKIKALYPHRTWSKFIWLDYPTSDSWKKHNAAIAKGRIDNSDRIGGQVGIHGVPEGGDLLIDQHINWTLGCISLKKKDINEIFSVVQTGTSIEIVH